MGRNEFDNAVYIKDDGLKKQIKDTFKSEKAFFSAYMGPPDNKYGLGHIRENHMMSEATQYNVLKDRLIRERMNLGETRRGIKMSGFNIRNFDDLKRLIPAIKYAIEHNFDKIKYDLENPDEYGRRTCILMIDLNQIIGTAVFHMGNQHFEEIPCSSLRIALMPSRGNNVFDIQTIYPEPNEEEKMLMRYNRELIMDSQQFDRANPRFRKEPEGEILPMKVAQEATKSIETCKGLIRNMKDISITGARLIKSEMDKPGISTDEKKKLFEMLMEKPIRNKTNIVDIVAEFLPEGQTQKIFDRCMQEQPMELVQAVLDATVVLNETDAKEDYGSVSKEQFFGSIKLAYEQIIASEGQEEAAKYLTQVFSDIKDNYEFEKDGEIEDAFIAMNPETFVNAIIEDNFPMDSVDKLLTGIKEAYKQISEREGIEKAETFLSETLDAVGENNIGLIKNEQAMQLRKEIADEQQFTLDDVANIMKQLEGEPEVEINDSEISIDDNDTGDMKQQQSQQEFSSDDEPDL